jgi:type II secretory ATPase GspE/PulE/Tfp pilus assembly ATPase PilB-like protein
MNEGIRRLIMERGTAAQIKEKAVGYGMKTLRQAGWEKVKKGGTTLQEVIRVTQQE